MGSAKARLEAPQANDYNTELVRRPPKAPKPRAVDEFDAYHRVFFLARFWFVATVVALIVIFGLIGVIVVQALQPPVVIVKDRNSTEKPAIARAGEVPPIERVDAENFFLYAIRKRWGWESPSVLRDWNELIDQMTEEMQVALRAYATEPVPPPGDPDGVPEARIVQLQRAAIRSEAVLSRDEIECRKGAPIHGVDQWYCRGYGFIETMPLPGTAALPEAHKIRRPVEFQARFQPAPYDKSGIRLFGLGIAYLHALSTEDADD